MWQPTFLYNLWCPASIIESVPWPRTARKDGGHIDVTSTCSPSRIFFTFSGPTTITVGLPKICVLKIGPYLSILLEKNSPVEHSSKNCSVSPKYGIPRLPGGSTGFSRGEDFFWAARNIPARRSNGTAMVTTVIKNEIKWIVIRSRFWCVTLGRQQYCNVG